MITDSHCHLDYLPLYNELENVVGRALKNDINTLLTICTTLESFDKIKLIINKYKGIYGTFGIHPHETEKYQDINAELIIKYKNENKKIIGIGETGLDYYYNHSNRDIQKKIFSEHILAAQKLNIPLIVHSRNAVSDTLSILENSMNNDDLKVVIHCFTGDKNFVKKLLDLGCFISISGIVTFKNSNELVEAVSFIPDDRLLVETDAPFLCPMPHRGKTNEPSFITHTIEKLSIIKGTNIKDIAEKTTKNFKQLFNIK